MIYIAVQLIQIFSAGPASQPRGSEVVQEVLADLISHKNFSIFRKFDVLFVDKCVNKMSLLVTADCTEQIICVPWIL